MDRLLPLVRGEFDRLNKYNLFTANFVVLLLWVGVAWFFEGEELKLFVPFIFVLDSTMMTILLVGATLFYEKQEHTMNSIMVSPVTEDEYLLSKVVVNILNSLITVVFISAALYFIKGITYNCLLLVPAVIVVTVVHTMIGILLSYHAKSFSSVLVNYIVYVFIFLLPTVLAMFGIINAKAAKYLIVLPPETANILIGVIVRDVDPLRLGFGYIYLAVLSFLLYRFIIKPKFNEYVMRETGV
ncbi:MAG: ABC transporter permease subunit [Dethiobacter sp.]|nr:ABC transporter permease subunit [Dethiobacter sp.]